MDKIELLQQEYPVILLMEGVGGLKLAFHTTETFRDRHDRLGVYAEASIVNGNFLGTGLLQFASRPPEVTSRESITAEYFAESIDTITPGCLGMFLPSRGMQPMYFIVGRRIAARHNNS